MKLIKTVDEYLSELPEDIQSTLQNLRVTIKEAAPEAQELISYKIPTYRHYGPLIHFMASANHLSLITVNKSIIEQFKEELKSFKTIGTTIHFSAENPIPEELIKKIVQVRIRQNEEQAN